MKWSGFMTSQPANAAKQVRSYFAYSSIKAREA